jgi:hypothetical protein
MWLLELDILENEYKEYQKEREISQMGDIKMSKKKTVGKATKKIVKKTTNIDIE